MRRRLMTLKTLVVPELYAGKEAEFQTLVEIEQERLKARERADDQRKRLDLEVDPDA